MREVVVDYDNTGHFTFSKQYKLSAQLTDYPDKTWEQDFWVTLGSAGFDCRFNTGMV